MIEKLKNTRILGAVGLLGLFLGVIMPYYQFSIFGYSYTIKLWGYWEGKLMMVLILANLLFIFRDYIEKYAPQFFDSGIGSKIKNVSPKFAIVPTIGVVAFAVWLFIRLDLDTTTLKHGFGFWSLWVGVICLVAHIFVYKKNETARVSPSISVEQVSYAQPQTGNSSGMGQTTRTTKYCPGCGNPCDGAAERCFMCGRSLQ